MTLIYRDRQPQGNPAPRWPSHLIGAEPLCRREAAQGAIVAICEPLYLDLPAEGTVWTPLPDDWEYCEVGTTDIEQLARKAPGCPILMVRDGLGHPWRIPAVLDPDGQPALPMKLGIVGHDLVDGQQVPRWEHRPTPAQSALLAAARGALAEIVAGKLEQLSMSIACGWAALGIATTYHLTPAQIGELGLLDARLTGRAIMAMAGRPVPEGD